MSGSQVLLAGLAISSGRHRCRVRGVLSAQREEPGRVCAAPSPPLLSRIYTHTSPYECVSLSPVGVSHSPRSQWERWEGLEGAQGCHKLNEVFIAVGTMSVPPGSRWRNGPREKEPRGGGRRGAGRVTWRLC